MVVASIGGTLAGQKCGVLIGEQLAIYGLFNFRTILESIGECVRRIPYDNRVDTFLRDNIRNKYEQKFYL